MPPIVSDNTTMTTATKKTRKSRTAAECRAALEAQDAKIMRLRTTATGEVEEYVVENCHNCGGTGQYPSSMIPAGQCRFYCWKQTGDLFGKEMNPLAKVIKRMQAADRRTANAAANAAKADAEHAARLADPDARVATLAAALDLDLANLPTDGFAASMIGQYLRKGTLSDKQWAWVEKLTAEAPERAAEKAKRDAQTENARDEIAPEGTRLDAVALRVTGNYYDDGPFGARQKVYMVDETGHRVLWTTTAGIAEDLEQGDRVELTGLIKKIYRNDKTIALLGGRVTIEITEKATRDEED